MKLDLEKKDLESRVLSLRGKHYSPSEIVKLTGADSPQQVQDILDKSKEEIISAYKATSKLSDTYSEVLTHTLRILRNGYHMNYRELAQALDEDEYVIFDYIRRNPVSSGKHSNYVKGYFTREEKRMRNEDMVRLNREGKTFAEIGKIFYVSKQNISQIFKEIKVKPLSEKEALSVGIDVEVTEEELALKDKNKVLSNKVCTLQKHLAMTKYYMNGLIQDLRVKYILSLSKSIINGNADEEDIKEYKLLHQTVMRTYNTMVKSNVIDTALFKQIDSIIPKLARTNALLK